MLTVIITRKGRIQTMAFDTIPEAIAAWEALVNEGANCSLTYIEM